MRIIDLSAVWAGPYAARLLADMGADVIKVEGVTNPDVSRGFINPAGKTDDSMAIELKIKPATLLVDGDANGNYGIEDFPSIVIKPGVPVSIPVRGYSGNWITVVDRAHPDKKEKVDLIAGQQKRVTFSP